MWFRGLTNIQKTWKIENFLKLEDDQYLKAGKLEEKKEIEENRVHKWEALKKS